MPTPEETKAWELMARYKKAKSDLRERLVSFGFPRTAAYALTYQEMLLRAHDMGLTVEDDS